jgi:tetratricopeptide (TPR) repeat protein
MRLTILSLIMFFNVQLICSQKILQIVTDDVCDCIGKEKDKGKINDPQILYTICIGRGMKKFQKQIKKEFGIDINDTSALNIKKAHSYGFQIGSSLVNECSNYISLINDIKKSKDGTEYFSIAEKNIENRQFDQAVINYTKAININPSNSDYLVSRGIAYNYIGDYYKAITDFTRALEIKPKDLYAYLNSSIAKNNLGDYKGALVDVDNAILCDSFSCESYNLRGNIYRGSKEYDKSIIALKKGYDCNPSNQVYSSDIGLIYLIEEQYKTALEWFNKSLSIGLSDNIYGYIGTCYDNLGNYDEGLKCYNKELERDSNNFSIHYNRAGIYNRKKNFEKALLDYLSSYKIDSTDAKSVFYMALMCQYLNKNEKAEMYFLQAQTMKEWDAGFYNLRADFYNNIKKYDLAITDYLVSLSLVSDNCKTWLSLGKAYLNSNNKLKAKEAFQKSAVLGCKDAVVFIKK